MSYVVTVKPPDDHPGAIRVFGFFREHHRAADFCAKVVAGIEKNEDPLEEFAGAAYVQRVRTPRVREAISWGARGQE